MNEECINISKCICQWRLMRVLFFSFCNIKIVALINSLLKPPSAALSAHTEERGEERGAIYSLLSLSLGKESERQIDKKKMHSFPPFLCLSFFFLFLFHREWLCIRIYGDAWRTPSDSALKSGSFPIVWSATFCVATRAQTHCSSLCSTRR